MSHTVAEQCRSAGDQHTTSAGVCPGVGTDQARKGRELATLAGQPYFWLAQDVAKRTTDRSRMAKKVLFFMTEEVRI